MDMRSGRTFETHDEAIKVGVSEGDIAMLGQHQDPSGQVVFHVETKGPFKGRCYRRNALGQMQRDRSEERRRKL